MGKVRAKGRKKSSRRPRPTGLPSVKETEEEMKLEPALQANVPVLDKLKAVSPSDRLWVCHSLLYLLDNKSDQQKLLKAGLLSKLLPLLLDGEVEVRGATATVLSKLLSTSDESFHQLSSAHTVSPLSAMLEQARNQLTAGSHGNTAEAVGMVNGQEETGSSVVVETRTNGQEGSMGMECDTGQEEQKVKRKKRAKKKAKERARLEKEQLQQQQCVEATCLGLQLLGSICERDSSVIDRCYGASPRTLVDTVLDLMLLLHQHPDVSVAAAQVLLTVLEEASPVVDRCVEHVAMVMDGVRGSPETSGLKWPVKASAAGVLYYLYMYMKDESPWKEEVLQVVMATFSNLLDAFLACDMSDQECAPVLQATVTAMEIITNMAYTDSSDVSDHEFSTAEEEGEEEEEQDEDTREDSHGGTCEGMEMESESSEIKDSVMENTLLSCVLKIDLHNKVLKIIHKLLSDTSSSGRSLLASSLCAFQNLVSSVPLLSWCGGCAGLVSLWASLLDKFHESCDPAAVSGVMVTLLDMLIKGDQFCISTKELEAVGRIGLTSELSEVRTDMMTIVGLVGQHCVHHSQANGGASELFTMVGGILKECVTKERCLSVVCHALDSIFDLFGSDSCPVECFTSLDLLPVLVECRASFNARYKVERKQFQSELSVIQMVRTNLPRFISYMKTRVT